MYLNRVTLIGFTGQEARTFATQSGKGNDPLVGGHVQTLSTRLGMEGENTMARLCSVRGLCSIRRQSPEKEHTSSSKVS